MSDIEHAKDKLKQLNEPTMVEKDEMYRLKQQRDAENGDTKAQAWVESDKKVLEKDGEVNRLERERREQQDGTSLRDQTMRYKDAQKARDEFRDTRPSRPDKEWDEQYAKHCENFTQANKALTKGMQGATVEELKALETTMNKSMDERQDLIEKRQEFGKMPSEREKEKEKQGQRQNHLEDGWAPGQANKERTPDPAVEAFRESYESRTKHGYEGFEESAMREREFQKRLEATQKEFQYQNDGRLPKTEEVESIWAKEDKEKQQGQVQKKEPAQHPTAGLENLGPKPLEQRKSEEQSDLMKRREARRQTQVQSQQQTQRRSQGQTE